MEKKPTKKAKPTPEYDSQRETRVILEKISSDVKIVAEGHSSLKQEITSLRGSMEQRFNIIEMAVTENSRDIKVIKVDVKILKEGQNKLRTDVEQLKSGQDKLEKGQDKLEKGQDRLEKGQEALRSDVEQLKSGQQKLEQGQEEIKQKLDTVTEDHETRLQKLEATP